MHDLSDNNGNSKNIEIRSKMRGGVANFSFFPNKDNLIPPPHDGLQVGSLLRYNFIKYLIQSNYFNNF